MMTRKDYVSTSEILWSVKSAVTPEVHEHLIENFSLMFSVDNPRFDKNRFFEACGLVIR
jgi:hypothetical protein